MSSDATDLKRALGTNTEDGAAIARRALRAAISAKDKAVAGLHSAEKAAERAKELLRDAEVQLAQFRDLDDLLVKHDAAAIKSWSLSNSTERPSFDLPPNLATRKIVREQAKERLAAAQAAHGVLDAELNAAKNALMEAERRVNVAAQEVMIEEAKPIARQLQEAREVAWHLADRLSGLAALWLPSIQGPPRAIAIPPNIIAVLMNDERPMGSNSTPRPEDREAEHWRGYHAALCTDADARFEDARAWSS